ncbi:ATP-binding protein [Bradyrhizobium sp. SRS-191]|uniref:ATP-binding protein n=1 Tax=Bradyrhizobium sp. SRS-191 TaxID=2962606 RepID=UPI00211E1C00|nr:ATP-binding protein [Bradyrhizobium sp. SRS-191]
MTITRISVPISMGWEAKLLIEVPGWEEPVRALEFGTTLGGVEEAPFYKLDFARVGFATPGWMLIIGNALRQFRQARPNAKRQAINFKHLGYAAHVGFFQYFGMEYGQAPAQAPGSNTYVPITEVSVAELRNAAAEKSLQVGELIEEDAQRLARLLTQLDNGDTVETLTYSIREIVRNVVEHSGSQSYSIAAQYWPGKNSAELAVSDSGCGILESLKENPKLQVGSDLDALKLSLLPGISSKAWRRRNSADAWANSGYGLFMTQRLCSLGGEFALLSGSAGMRIVGTETSTVKCKMAGTTVILRIDAGKVSNLSKRLAEFRDDGARLAKLVGGASTLGPSLASQVLKPTTKPGH